MTIPPGALDAPTVGRSGRRSALLALACLPVACAAPRPQPSRAAAARFLLLGEVHDNPDGHARRLELIRRLPADPRRALVFEQLDAGRQPQIDLWRARSGAPAGADSARALAASGGCAFDAWDFDAYRPLLELALERGWRVCGGNLSRETVMRIASSGSGALPPPPGWSPADTRALEEAVREGHCGLLPDSRLAPMAAAQRSRDARMAGAMLGARRAGASQVVLIAGNGHVRRDHGVPRHLPGARPDAGVYAVGFLEDPPRDADAFDAVVVVPAHPRGDPCEPLRRRFGRNRR